MSGEHVSAWAADGFPLQVREIPRAEFAQLATDPAAVAVQDSGFTEVAYITCMTREQFRSLESR